MFIHDRYEETVRLVRKISLLSSFRIRAPDYEYEIAFLAVIMEVVGMENLFGQNREGRSCNCKMCGRENSLKIIN